MRNLSIKTRLVGVMFLLSSLLVLLGAGALFSLSRTNDSLKTVYEDRLVSLTYLDAVATSMLGIQVDAGAMLDADAAGVERQLDKVKGMRAVADKAWRDYKATSLTDEEARLADEFVRARRAAAEEGVDPYVAAVKAGDKEKAISLLHGKVDPSIRDAMRAMGALIKLQQDVAAGQYRQSQQRYASFRAAAIGAILAGVLMAAGMGWWLVAAITRPLTRAVGIAESVAAGDLTRQITVESSDEMGQLTAALKRMNDSLASIVGNVRHGTETIGVAAGEIAQGNADLSGRTEAQASALEETASSMEELTGTVRQNADNARSANGLALAASEVAQRGGDVVAQVVERMGAISAASTRIADIIGVIDGIAFQTNILALNAAVEAARAGEQGRGFAVVATEVRNLAHRSAAAAKEVKTLIDDSVTQVDAGSRLVGEAGATMKDVVASVRRVTDIMAEIMAASVEQNAGIGQINDAVAEMDSATQQNAALVEQAAAAAAAMREQAAQLSAAVAVFKVAGIGAVEPAARAEVPARVAAPVRAARKLDSARKLETARLAAADGWEQF